MALTDNLLIKVKAETGQTVITDSINAYSWNTGTGTATLVDDGTYGPLWRITGGSRQADLSSPTRGFTNSSATAYTLALRFRITNRAANSTKFHSFGSASPDRIFGVANNGSSSGGLTEGVYSSGAVSGAIYPSYTSGTVVTFVMQFKENGGSADESKLWIGTTGRSGTTPDATGVPAYANTWAQLTYDKFLTVSETLDILDYAVWDRALTDSEASAVADDIRGQLTIQPNGTGTGSLPTITITPPTLVASGTAVATGSINGVTFVAPSGTGTGTSGSTLNGTGTGAGPTLSIISPSGSATGTSPSVGTLTTPPIKNNAGGLLFNETGVTVNIYNATTGALIVQLINQVSNASGIVTVNHVLIVAGTSYAYEVILSDGRRRLPLASAT